MAARNSGASAKRPFFGAPESARRSPDSATAGVSPPPARILETVSPRRWVGAVPNSVEIKPVRIMGLPFRNRSLEGYPNERAMACERLLKLQSS
ncbi:hypothetical protein D3C87_1953140 [compost metagenome]